MSQTKIPEIKIQKERSDALEIGVHIVFCLLMIPIIFYDVKYHKIPNKFIIIGMVSSWVGRFLEQGVKSVGMSLGCMLIPFLLLFPLFVMRMIGAGDIKLLCMFAFMMTPMQVIFLLFFACLIGGIWAIVKMIRDKSLFRRFLYLKNFLARSIAIKEAEKYFSKEEGYRDTISFALPIGLSYLLHLGGVY